MANNQRNCDSSIRIRHTKNAESLIQRLPELVDVRRRQFIGGIVELEQMTSTPCSMAQFRQYIGSVFAGQLQGTMNDVRGDKSTPRPQVLDDLPAWPSVLHKFAGESIGSDLVASRGTAWSAYQAITEYISHESGRAKDPLDAARQRLESVY